MRLDKMTITAVWSFSVVFMFWGLSADDASDKVSRWRRNEGGSGGDDWSNSSNWSDGRVPGRCKNGDSISGEAGWTAILMAAIVGWCEPVLAATHHIRSAM